MQQAARLVPPLGASLHKGQCGRIAVVGGSRDYTGAPFYAAITAYRMGADLAYVLCTPAAATPIKCYSPELVVLPVVDGDGADAAAVLPRLHALVVGPGLGREPAVLAAARRVIAAARASALPTVLDADALFLAAQDPSTVHGFKEAVLTPNVVEFARLYKAVLGSEPPADQRCATKELATSLGGVTIVAKGPTDIISDGEQMWACDAPGALRRCGGQGDVLAGSIGVFLAWRAIALKTRAESAAGCAPGAAALGGCLFTRACSRAAFEQRKRAMTTPDVIERVGDEFERLFPCSL